MRCMCSFKGKTVNGLLAHLHPHNPLKSSCSGLPMLLLKERGRKCPLKVLGEMGGLKIQSFECKRDEILPISQLGPQWRLPDDNIYPVSGLFASVGQTGNMGFGVSPNSSNPRGEKEGFKLPCSDLCAKYLPSSEGFKIVGITEEERAVKKKKGGLKLMVKITNPSLRRLTS